MHVYVTLIGNHAIFSKNLCHKSYKSVDSFLISPLLVPFLPSFPPMFNTLPCPVQNFITSLSQVIAVAPISVDKPHIKHTSEHDNTPLVCDNFCDEVT